ncbi:MAG: 50S ribosomal protein L29 [Desulfovibrio sp.]|jgi:large subunit ribosomal protein L29|nr:50S ribosomal protein L29 [Desulfovibrio sp.]
MARKKDFPTAEELRGLSDEELVATLARTRKEHMQSRFKHALAQLERTSQLKAMRRQVARVATVLAERRAGSGGGAGQQ